MLNLPNDLTTLPDDDLYQSLYDLLSHKMLWGRGRSPEAQHVRQFCKAECRRLDAEIRRRGLPALRPQANRWVRQPAQGN